MGWKLVTALETSLAQPAATKPALSVRNVSLTYGETTKHLVLDDISFDVREGEFLSIVGPSGCGKTTLLRLLAGLLPASSGQIDFGGTPISGPSRERAIVFQDYTNALLPWRTAAPVAMNTGQVQA